MESSVFKTCGQINLTVETYKPVISNGKGLIFYYGGGWMNDNRSRFRPFAKELALDGYVVFLPQYRVYNVHRVSPGDGMEDVADGIRFIYETLLPRFPLPREAVAWGGSSAGGHLCLCAALLEPYRSKIGFCPRKLVLFHPVCCPDSLDEWVKSKCGMHFDFEGLCPLNDMRGAGPEILAMHGTADEIAPYEALVDFAARYGKLGGICQIKSYEGRSHGFCFSNEEDYRDAFLSMRCFLEREESRGI